MEYEMFDQVIDDRKGVELIASGYEWNCPECETFNTEIEITEHVECDNCNQVFFVSESYHARG